MKAGPKLWRAAGIAILLAAEAAMFSVAFFLTALIYQRRALHPSPYVAQLIDSLLGVSLLMLAIFILSRFFAARGAATLRRTYGPIIDALDRIAKGDFSIRLDDALFAAEDRRFRDNMVGELVQSVNHMAHELNQLENMRQEFISDVSHEIQSPLTSIRGFARALQNGRLSPEEQSHYLAIIETESIRLSRITENLLRLASLESRQVKFEPQPIRLDRQIRGLILACEPQWAGKGIEMDAELEEVTANADEDMLSQVWTNLIHNAIKFTPGGGRVCVALRRQDDRAEFRISDTGIGIAEEDRAHVFERFYKADKARQRTEGGSGLGLSIARKIVEMHLGTIGLESEAGQGATFTVSLPLQFIVS